MKLDRSTRTLSSYGDRGCSAGSSACWPRFFGLGAYSPVGLGVGHDESSGPLRLGRIAMSSPHRPLNRRSGLVLDTRELGRRAGAMKAAFEQLVEAPADLGIAVIGVPPGSPIELDLRLESVVEGVLVSGTASVQGPRGVRTVPWVRSLISSEVDIQELYVYPGVEQDDDLRKPTCRAISSTSSHCSVTRWFSICHSSPCAGMTVWASASSVVPT